MKIEHVLILLIGLLMADSIKAQEKQTFETKFGRKDAINLSHVLFQPQVDQIPTYGFLTGFCLKDVSNKGLGIQVELNISQLGWKEKLDSTNTYFHRLNYIQFPMMTHVALGNDKGKFVINVGPCANWLIDEKEVILVAEDFEKPPYYDLGIDSKFGLGLCLGLGYEKITSFGSFQFETRVYQYLFDIFNRGKINSFTMSKNQNIEFGISYLYSIKGRKNEY